MKIRATGKRHRQLFFIGGMFAFAIVGLIVAGTAFVTALPQDDISWSLGSGFTKSPNQLFYGNIDNTGNRTGGDSGGRHVIRATANGENNMVTLRVYYKQRPTGGKGSVRINVSACNFSQGGRLQVEVSNSSVSGSTSTSMPYNEPVRPDVNKIAYVYDKRGYPAGNLGDRDRVLESSSNMVYGSPPASAGQFNESRVCTDTFKQDNVPVYRANEGCNNPATPATKCKGSGNNEYFTATSGSRNSGLVNTGTTRDNIVVAHGNPLDGQTFAPVLQYDSEVEMWKGTVIVRITGATVETDESKSMRFTARSLDGGYVAYGKQSGDDGTAYGVNVAGGWGNGTNGTKVVVPFGLTCNQSGDRGSVRIYDPETGNTDTVRGFGPSYVKVFYNYIDESGNTHTGLLNGNTASPHGYIQGGSHATLNGSVVKLDGNNRDTSIIAVEMKQGYRYAMMYYNPEDGKRWEIGNTGSYTGESTSNTISFSVPTDSINGLINCNYNLTPHISINKDKFPIKTNLGPQGSVTNVDGAVSGGDHSWQVVKAEFRSKPNLKPQTDNTDDPCGFLSSMGSLERPCSLSRDTPDYPGTSTWSDTGATGEVPLGHWVCYMTSVKKPTLRSSDATWRHSTPACAVSGISPKVQVWGGDLKVEKGIITGQDTLDGKTYGSWGEYGVMSNCINNGMASGAGLNGGSVDVNERNKLTFANTPPPLLGCFGVTAQSPNVRSTITSPLTYVQHFETSRTYGRNTNQVYDLRGYGAITIGGDQVYGGEPYRKIGEIPRVIILADSFRISNNVQRIDPWLITAGSIETCAEVNKGDRLSSRTCGSNLTFNGPVYANQVYLYRTAGSRLSSLNEPAELFNLRADAYLSAIAGNSDTSVATTDSVIELPPRF